MRLQHTEPEPDLFIDKSKSWFHFISFWLLIFDGPVRFSSPLRFIGGVGTQRRRQSPDVTCAATRNCPRLSLPPPRSPALLFNILGSGQRSDRWGCCWRSQPPPATHGTAGAGSQSNGWAYVKLWHLFPLLCLCVLFGPFHNKSH